MMLNLNLEKATEKLNMHSELYASVCNSCACGGGTSSCNTTCKGCKDKGQNIAEAKKAYSK